MSYVKIPVNNAPNSVQSFSVTLDKGKRNIKILLKLKYMDLFKTWLVDVLNAETGKPLIYGLPLVCGVNLLEQYSHMRIGEAYIIPASNTEADRPDNTMLGSEFVLVWGDNT